MVVRVMIPSPSRRRAQQGQRQRQNNELGAGFRRRRFPAFKVPRFHRKGGGEEVQLPPQPQQPQQQQHQPQPPPPSPTTSGAPYYVEPSSLIVAKPSHRQSQQQQTLVSPSASSLTRWYIQPAFQSRDDVDVDIDEARDEEGAGETLEAGHGGERCGEADAAVAGTGREAAERRDGCDDEDDDGEVVVDEDDFVISATMSELTTDLSPADCNGGGGKCGAVARGNNKRRKGKADENKTEEENMEKEKERFAIDARTRTKIKQVYRHLVYKEIEEKKKAKAKAKASVGDRKDDEGDEEDEVELPALLEKLMTHEEVAGELSNEEGEEGDDVVAGEEGEDDEDDFPRQRAFGPGRRHSSIDRISRVVDDDDGDDDDDDDDASFPPKDADAAEAGESRSSSHGSNKDQRRRGYTVKQLKKLPALVVGDDNSAAHASISPATTAESTDFEAGTSCSSSAGTGGVSSHILAAIRRKNKNKTKRHAAVEVIGEDEFGDLLRSASSASASEFQLLNRALGCHLCLAESDDDGLLTLDGSDDDEGTLDRDRDHGSAGSTHHDYGSAGSTHQDHGSAGSTHHDRGSAGSTHHDHGSAGSTHEMEEEVVEVEDLTQASDDVSVYVKRLLVHPSPPDQEESPSTDAPPQQQAELSASSNQSSPPLFFGMFESLGWASQGGQKKEEEQPSVDENTAEGESPSSRAAPSAARDSMKKKREEDSTETTPPDPSLLAEFSHQGEDHETYSEHQEVLLQLAPSKSALNAVFRDLSRIVYGEGKENAFIGRYGDGGKAWIKKKKKKKRVTDRISPSYGLGYTTPEREADVARDSYLLGYLLAHELLRDKRTLIIMSSGKPTNSKIDYTEPPHLLERAKDEVARIVTERASMCSALLWGELHRGYARRVTEQILAFPLSNMEEVRVEGAARDVFRKAHGALRDIEDVLTRPMADFPPRVTDKRAPRFSEGEGVALLNQFSL